MPDSFLDAKDRRVLELEMRRNIYETVRKYAGCHFREIQRRSKLPAGTLRYHLDYLEKNNLINSHRDGKNLRYYPRDFKHQNALLMGLLRQEKIRQIILFILLHNSCTQVQISIYVKLSGSTTSWHLKRLEEAGVLKSARKGRSKHYNLIIDEKELANLLITYQESFLDSLVDNVIEMWE